MPTPPDLRPLPVDYARVGALLLALGVVVLLLLALTRRRRA